MRISKVISCLIAFAISLSAASCWFWGNQDEPDKLGSWGQINQEVKKGANWQRIVHDSSFQLGEKIQKEGEGGSRGAGEEDYSKSIYYEAEYGTYPSIDGSTVAVPMAMEFAWQHLDLTEEDAAAFTYFTTTHSAYENLILSNPNEVIYGTTPTFMDKNHPVDIIIATEPSDEELEMAKEHNVELTMEPVCYDAFVFITHKDNPVESLTIKQVQDIYSGKITNWKDVGGHNSPITAYQREENSGSQTAMEKLVMNGIPMMPPKTVNIDTGFGMGMLIEAVAEYQNNSHSIGYTYQYYIDVLYKNDNIKVLNINGVSSGAENLRSNAYPFTTNYYGVIRSTDRDKTGGRFLDWMVSEEGQQCIEQAGYIPMG